MSKKNCAPTQPFGTLGYGKSIPMRKLRLKLLHYLPSQVSLLPSYLQESRKQFVIEVLLPDCISITPHSRKVFSFFFLCNKVLMGSNMCRCNIVLSVSSGRCSAIRYLPVKLYLVQEIRCSWTWVTLLRGSLPSVNDDILPVYSVISPKR